MSVVMTHFISLQHQLNKTASQGRFIWPVENTPSALPIPTRSPSHQSRMRLINFIFSDLLSGFVVVTTDSYHRRSGETNKEFMT